MRQFQLEFLRNFQNYLSSVKSLVDHTRNLTKKTENTNFIDFYELQKTKFLTSNVISFVQNLRDYSLHNRILPIATTVTIKATSSSEERSVIILKKELLEYSNWSSKSKSFLKIANEAINVMDFINEYQAHIENFYNSFFKEIESLYKLQLEEYTELQDEYKKVFNIDFLLKQNDLTKNEAI